MSFTNGKIVGWYDTTPDGSPEPEDMNSHGTHCASIAAGYKFNSIYDQGRIKSTWSVKYYNPSLSTLSGYFTYYIDVQAAGTISITTWWLRGCVDFHHLELAPSRL